MKTALLIIALAMATVIHDQDLKVGSIFGMKVSEVNQLDQIVRAGFKAQGKDVTKLTGDDLRVFQMVGNLKDWTVTDSQGKQNGGNTLIDVQPDNVAEMRGEPMPPVMK